MRRLLRSIIGLVALFSPMSNLSAQSETVATYPIRNYKLAEYAVGQENLESVSVFSLVKKTLGADSVTKVELVGYADATPWKSCGKNASCSDHKNQTLALLRASTISQKFSLEYGINPSRINARGEVSNSRGGEFRGVTVYISRDKGRSSAPVVAQVNPNSFDDVNALRREIAGLRDTVTMLMHRNSVEVSAPAQPTSPKESPTNVTIQTVAPTSIKIERPVNVDVGAGIATVNTNHIDAFAPIVSVFIRPRASPVEFFLNGGFRPSSSLNLCNRADVIGSLGAQVGTRRPIGASFGLYTAREMCSDGGPKLNERWLDRTNGVFVGPKLNFRVMGVNGSFNPALTWSNTYRAEERKDYNGWGLKFDFNIRTFGNQKP